MNNAAATPTVGQIYKVALAAIIGSVIEQYDFLVTGVLRPPSGAASSSNCRASPPLLPPSASTVSASSSVRSAPTSSAISLTCTAARTPWSMRWC